MTIIYFYYPFTNIYYIIYIKQINLYIRIRYCVTHIYNITLLLYFCMLLLFCSLDLFYYYPHIHLVSVNKYDFMTIYNIE